MPINLDHFQDLIENSVHMIMRTDAEGVILYVNPAWQQALGYEASTVISTQAADLVHSDYRTDYDKLFRQALAGNKLSHFETSFLAENGRLVAVEGSMSCSLVNGRPHAVQGVFQNISDRKRAEDMLVRQATEMLRVHTSLEARDRELADTLEQARKYREAEARADELTAINEALTLEIGRRQEAEATIRASLQEKEVLLKEIHHRVKNNLQIISSLLNLQSGYIDDARTQEMFKESQSRIQSMALIHEKLYQSEDLARVDFSEYIVSLVNFLMRSYSPGGVNIALDVEPVFLSLDTSIPCGLIVSELVSNSCKYAFPEGRSGEIYVRLKPIDNEHYELGVGDTGIGFPEDVDFQETESLGLQLVTTLADQLDGEIELDRSKGTEFRIRFRVHKSDRAKET
ncbi:MAG: PAS domain S-box protein [Candidatus Latescibacteria bacterium]|nr:PAS domain S-box protein [Candidatus Latescibacterota bacterium]MBT5830031.1 PAS domain S-box protein [Candidatus Latescibacterota bacterium]